jgi:outer membrane protein assembly factor BamB
MRRRTALLALLGAGSAWAARGAFGEPSAPSAALPDAETYGRSWPSFRGPNGSGVSVHAGVPSDWDGRTGKGILWKSALPLPGANSPIVFEDRVFLSGANARQREVYCFHADTGKLLWRTEVGPKQPLDAPLVEVSRDTTYAAPTMATDGRTVYALFAGGELAALDFAGNEIWRRSLGPLTNHYGHASSLANWRGRVIVQLDQGAAKDGLSKLLALDGANGHVIWQVNRPMPASWCSPIVVEHASEPLVITGGDPWVIAYSAKSGDEIWRADCLAPAEVAATPVYSDGVVFAANEYAALSAIAADGRGDVTATHVRWTADAGLPDICSPLVAGDCLLLLTSSGMLTCYDKQRGGPPAWEQDLRAEFAASPGLAVGRVYVFNRHGQASIIEPMRDNCRIIAQCELGEEAPSSPAFQDGRIYIRGSQHLFCIGR